MKRKVAPMETAKRVLESPGTALKVAALGTAGAMVLTALKRSRNSEVQKIQEAVHYLQSQLGARMTAYLSGEDDSRIVDLWIDGQARPDRLHWMRLLSAFEATRCLVKAYDDQTARTWFVGMNPAFHDQSPARVLRTSRSPRVWDDVVLAAREFAET